MHALALQTAAAYRLGIEAEGHACLGELIGNLQDSITRGTLAIAAEDFLQFADAVLDAQQRGDFLWLADLLEYELAPALAPPGTV